MNERFSIKFGNDTAGHSLYAKAANLCDSPSLRSIVHFVPISRLLISTVLSNGLPRNINYLNFRLVILSTLKREVFVNNYSGGFMELVNFTFDTK